MSLREELCSGYSDPFRSMFVLVLAHTSVSRIARTNAFEVMFWVKMDDG